MTSIGQISRDDLDNFMVSSFMTVQYGFLTGFLLGGYSAGQRAALQFLAENQHEIPKTRAQAMQYHRNKNYKMMAAFGVGGIKRGSQLAAVAAAWSLIKKSLEFNRTTSSTPLLVNPHFDDLIAGSIIGSSFFLLSNRRQKYFHFKKGFLLGTTLGASLSLVKFVNLKFSNKIANP
jgi:hypothetical protein